VPFAESPSADASPAPEYRLVVPLACFYAAEPLALSSDVATLHQLALFKINRTTTNKRFRERNKIKCSPKCK
jgi:hypothetical protein